MKLNDCKNLKLRIVSIVLVNALILLCNTNCKADAKFSSGSSGGPGSAMSDLESVNNSQGPCGPNGKPDPDTNPNAANVDEANGGTGGNESVTVPMIQATGEGSVPGSRTPGTEIGRTFRGPKSIARRGRQVGKMLGVYPDSSTGPLAALESVLLPQRAAMESRPLQNAMIGQGQAMGAATCAADVAGEIGHNMSQTAINFAAESRENFTVDGGNKWNAIRNQIFVPIALLLLLPGAVLAQLKAIMAAGNPVLGHVNPFDGILRSLVAIFLIPGTYLICNYGIDLSNSLTHTISSEYSRLFGSDMYTDAICAEFKAMPWRLPEENRNTIDIPVSSMGIVLLGNQTPFAQLEAELIAVKIYDPCAGIYLVPPDRANEAVPAASMAARMATNSANAALATSWSILCAFQQAYFYYLWCVGPVVAALWVWPMKQLRDALPSWIEGVLTVCFWSFFWNTVILLMAAFRGVDETGTITMLALNTLANISVKLSLIHI